MRKHIRGNLKTEELAPSCIRITNNSADFYLSVGIKISRAKLRKLIPYLSGNHSEESIAIPKTEPLSICGKEFSTINHHKIKHSPAIVLPKIEDISAKKFFACSKPLTDKLSKRGKSFHKPKPIKRETLTEIEKISSRQNSPRQKSPAKNKIITKVSYKEASHFPEWAMIAKPELEKI